MKQAFQPGNRTNRLTGWLLDVYPDRAGMVLWFLDDEGRRLRLVDPFQPCFYAAGSPALLAGLNTDLRGAAWPLDIARVERCELGAPEPVPVLAVAVRQPSVFDPLVRRLISVFPQARFYHVDVPLAQRYFYDKGLFPLARCEAEIGAEGAVLAIQATDSPWDLDYVTPPLAVLELLPDSRALNPAHGGPAPLLVRIDGEERRLEGDDRAIVERLQALLARHDPDLILTDWGDSYLLPRLLALAERLRLPLALNRDAGRPVEARRSRSYFSYGRIVANAGARTLYGRLHIDRRNSFIVAEAGLAGLIEQSRVTKVALQRMARTTTGTGITAMQLETAHRDGLLIPYRKREPEAFKSAWDLLRTDQGGLVFAPTPGYHEQVGELDFASMYPAIMTRFNISPETVNCACCARDPEACVPEIGHHTCRRRDGLVPRTLRPLLRKRAQYKERLKAAGDPAVRQRLDQRQRALKWLLVVSFGYLGYKNARFGRIEAHESVTAYSREILLQAKEVAEAGGFRFLHAIVDSLWLQKPGATRADYEALARTITLRTGLPIVVEGLYRWIGFLPSRVHPALPVPNQFVGVFDHGGVKIRGLEIRRADAPLLVKRMQAELIECLGRAGSLAELRALLPQAVEILRTYRTYLREGPIELDELVIAKALSRDPQAYRTRTATAVAAQELLARGVRLQPGETIHYVIADAGAAYAGDRVRAVPLSSGGWSYDVSAYDELLLKAAHAVLASLGMDADRLARLSGPAESPPSQDVPR
ncbi:MAG: hypothetical protein FJ245_14415 [Nitrospira sp.]|nr:hypothetical protein [Nitrospira sp.]